MENLFFHGYVKVLLEQRAKALLEITQNVITRLSIQIDTGPAKFCICIFSNNTVPQLIAPPRIIAQFGENI